MSHTDEATRMPEKQKYRICGPLAWEETEGGIRIVELLESTETVTVPDKIEGRPVVELGPGCFVGKEKLETVILPDTLKKIGRMAFSTCRHLKTLILPDSVEELGSHMLSDTAITSLKLPKNLKAIPECAFSYCKCLKKVELNDGLLAIGTHAFYRTRVGEDEPLVIPDSVEKIEAGAFFTFIGTIKVKTKLPVDPFWFADLPAPFSPAPAEEPSMMTSITSPAILGKLRDAVIQLSQVAVETRWYYQEGFMTRKDIQNHVGDSYQTVIYKLSEDLHEICRENNLDWNDADFRYLNEVLMISCGLGYRLIDQGRVIISLLEDAEENPDLKLQMHRLILGKQ